MSKLTPITAKVQKGTKGGMIKQPLLNMGAPVKMKNISPAKQASNNVESTEEQAGKTTKLAKLGTAERKAQYDAKGWKYDDTIAGYNKSGREKEQAVTTSTKGVSIENEISAPKVPAKVESTSNSKTSTRKEIRSARKAYRSGQISKSQKKSIIAEEKAMKKDSMAKKKKC